MQGERFRQIRLKFGFSYEILQHNRCQYFRYSFGLTFPKNPTKLMLRSSNDAAYAITFSPRADEFGGFGAVFGTALKERN